MKSRYMPRPYSLRSGNSFDPGLGIPEHASNLKTTALTFQISRHHHHIAAGGYRFEEFHRVNGPLHDLKVAVAALLLLSGVIALATGDSQLIAAIKPALW